MEHFYEKIDGWFDFQSIYTNMVNKFKSGSHFVEIGAWLGKSTSYMAVEIINSGKNIKFDVLDTWEGSKGGANDESLHSDLMKNLDDSLYNNFLKNIDPVRNYINPIQAWSFDVVDKYNDKSLDFVFIDGAHDYESVKRDIIDWYPKVKDNGVIGGHDYNIHDWPGVVQAVNEFFGEENVNNVKKDTWSWFVNKNDIEQTWILEKNNSGLKICVFSICFNEEDILPFYLDYYINFVKVDKIVVYDGGSTDNTHKILKEYPQVELIVEKQNDYDDQYLKNKKNNIWKKYHDEFDWIIVCDIDEFLYHPNIQEKLLEYKQKNITIPKTKGYDMISLKFPEFIKGNYLPYVIIKGIPENHFLNKNIIFNPKKIDNINYDFGCHDCNPTGNIKYNDERELFMLHYKWLGYDYLTKRYKFLSDRRSEWNIQHDASKHFVTNSQITLDEYIKKYNNSTNIFKMKHFYENIDGWFDFKEFYSEMVNKFSSGSHFVEIGAWLGKSTSYMAVEIINSGKNIKFDVVDTWEGSKNFIDENVYKINGNPYEIFIENLKIVKNYINPIKGNSDKIFEIYKDKTLDFVFIDAGHDYNSVINDIKNWYPKVKINGVIAGHDYYVYPDVKKAVDEYFGNNIRIDNSLTESCGTWIVEKINTLKKIIDNKIEPIDDIEQLKILQLNELENFMKIENDIPFIDDEKIIEIKNINHENGKVKKLLPYLMNRGYEINEKNENLILSIKKEKDIYIFSHNYLINNWKEILEEQLNKILVSGLYKNSTKLFLFAFGDDEQWNIFENLIDTYDKDNKIEIKRFNDNFYEYYTLQNMWNFCQNIEESYILYFHLKGVWSSFNLQINNEDEFDPTIPQRNPESIKNWRNCLEYFNIERWYNCVDELKKDHEVVGALYNYDKNCPIFTGNFWWTNSNYVQKLEYPKFEKEKELYDAKLWIRIKCEKWITSITNNFYNFYNPKDLGIYYIPILPEDYRDDINPLISILTPTYKRYDDLKIAINSVINQTYSNWEMLICSDGHDEKTESLIKEYNMDNIKYFFTKRTNENNYGSTQRNYLTNICKGKYIIYLDDDNIIYPKCLETIVKNIDSSIGMIIYRIDYDGLDYCLPKEDKIILGKIDTLNFVVDKYYTNHAIWYNSVETDYTIIKICENNILNHNKNIKFIPDIIGKHVDKKSLIKKVKYSFITPTYKRYKTLKRCIDSVLSQIYDNWEMLICSDGFDNKVKNIIELYNDNRITYSFTEPTNFFGSHQRNSLLNKTTGDYVIFLDDDNYIYDNHLKIINENIDNSDILIYHINFENYEYSVIPLENKIEHRKIDTLNFVVKRELTTRYKWKKIYESDYLYFKSIEADIVEENGKIKYLSNILAVHTDKSKINEEDIKDISINIPVVIMTAHPNFKTSEEITKKAIESLKPLNTDIILSTHCPISQELQSAATHFIFDKNNPLIRHDYYNQSWFEKEDYYALIKLHKNDNDLQHALAVYINYYNGILHAKSLGYTTAICANFDIIFDKDDLNIIKDRINEMYQNNKKSFFMTSNANEGIHYKTIFFITNIDFFIENFKYVTNETDYNLLTREVGSETNCLENFFYQTLKIKSEQLLLQEINEGDLFSKSKVNLFSNIEYFTILPLKNNSENFVIWFSSSNSFDDNRNLTIKVFDETDCIYVKNDVISKNYVFFKKIKFEKNHKYLIYCQITYNEMIKEKQIIIDNNSFNKLNENGEFLDKKNIDDNKLLEKNKIVDYSFENYGCHLNFTWVDEDKNIVIYIIDGYTKLKFYKTNIRAIKNNGYWIETPNNVKHKIFRIYDELEKNILFEIENNEGFIDLSSFDHNKYFENIGYNDLSHNMLAVPLYEMYVSNIYEHDKCKIENGDVVFDIGANIGMFTYYSLYKNCKKCYSFEPNSELSNVIKNKNISNVIVENVAISNENGNQDFFISKGGISSCLEKNNNSIIYENNQFHRGNDIFDKISVKTINIMDYIKLNNIEKIDYFKCDCEGGEYDIVDSMEYDYLTNNVKKMLIEYHYLFNPIYKSKYLKMVEKLVHCGFKYENNNDDNKVNDGVLFLWKD